MSFNAPPPAGPPEPPSAPPGAPIPTPRPAPTQHPYTSKFPDLHSLSVDIVSDLQALATGLHHMGASPEAVQSIVAMTNTIHQVSQHLAQAPPVPNPAHGGAPAAAQAPAGPPHGEPAGPPPGAAPGGPPQGQGSNNPHKALGNAIAALHQQAFEKAQQGPQ